MYYQQKCKYDNCVQDIIPFGNHPVFRYLLGWIMPAKVALLKLTQTDTIKRLYNEHHFIDDFILPISYLKKSVEKFHKRLNVIEKTFITSIF